MNIVYLHRTQGGGVEGVHIWSIVESFKKLGHSVVVVSPSGIQSNRNFSDSKSQNSGGVPRKRKKNTIFHYISLYMPELMFEIVELAYNIVLAKRIRAMVERQKIDLIYERYAIFSTAGSSISSRYGIPHILEVNYTASTPLVRERSRLLKPLAIKLDARIFSRTNSIVAVSSYLKKQLIDVYGLGSDKIEVIPNAADPEKFLPGIKPVVECCGYPLKDSKVIGFVGGFYPWHGLDLLVSAFGLISEDIPSAKLLLIGDGPESEKIKSKVRNLSLEDKVIFAGKIEHNNLPNFVAAFDVGVMPDSNEYGSPMKIFEYMSMAKPVIVPDYGPLRDVIDHGNQGMIFKKRDVDALSKCFSEVLSNDDLRKRLGENARNYIIQQQNWMNNAKRTLDSFSEKLTQTRN